MRQSTVFLVLAFQTLAVFAAEVTTKAVLPGGSAWAQEAAQAPLRNPNRPAQEEPPVPEPKPVSLHPGEASALPWTDEELDGEQNRCDAMLSGLDLRYEHRLPLREGRCGAARPVKLISIGRDPAVTVRGPAVVTCDMAAGLARWMREEVQPSAIELLGAPVTELSAVAAYVCRNRYGDLDKPVSEHALANALDIAAFVTAKGERISVLDHWGQAGKEIPLPLRKPPPPNSPSTSAPVAAATPEAGPTMESAQPAAVKVEAKVEPPPEPEPAPPPPDPKSLFLHGLHASACRLFGTVLGPDANAAHRDHFHLDMAERRYGNFCQ